MLSASLPRAFISAYSAGRRIGTGNAETPSGSLMLPSINCDSAMRGGGINDARASVDVGKCSHGAMFARRPFWARHLY
jgi:hypothetical protein